METANGKLDDDLDGYLNGGRGKHASACVKYRQNQEKSDIDEVIDGLPHSVQFIDGKRFYSPRHNRVQGKKLKFNEIFFLESDFMKEILRESVVISRLRVLNNSAFVLLKGHYT